MTLLNGKELTTYIYSQDTNVVLTVMNNLLAKGYRVFNDNNWYLSPEFALALYKRKPDLVYGAN